MTINDHQENHSLSGIVHLVVCSDHKNISHIFAANNISISLNVVLIIVNFMFTSFLKIIQTIFSKLKLTYFERYYKPSHTGCFRAPSGWRRQLRTHAHTHSHSHTCTCTHAHTYTQITIHAQMYACTVHTDAYTSIDTCIYIYIYTLNTCTHYILAHKFWR